MSEQIQQDKNPQVWLAVLHYTGADLTRACLRSIEKLRYRPFEVLITDNCSPDASGKSLKEEFPNYHYQLTPENLGFAGGSNASLNYCIERGADWVWLLNNDTELDPDSLGLLLAEAEANVRAGILGASIYTPSGSGLHRSGTGQIDFMRGKTLERGAIDDSQKSIKCEWLSGCNMFFRAAAFKEVGGFDEKFFLYYEDTDLCLRMNEKNWQCLIVPAAKLTHIVNASTQGRLAIWRSYYNIRNRLYFFSKVKKGLASLPSLFAIFAHVFRHCLVLPFRGKDGKRQLKAELLGLRDFLSGRLGKADCLDF